jgi:hypothetical protein
MTIFDHYKFIVSVNTSPTADLDRLVFINMNLANLRKSAPSLTVPTRILSKVSNSLHRIHEPYRRNDERLHAKQQPFEPSKKETKTTRRQARATTTTTTATIRKQLKC